jgi:hypothetical protein
LVKKNVFWEERGLGEFGGKGLVRDQLDVVAQAAAAAVLVTAPMPRDLRDDPCEEKSKRDALAVEDKGALMLVFVGVDLVNIAVPPFTPGTKRRSSQKYAITIGGYSPIF